MSASESRVRPLEKLGGSYPSSSTLPTPPTRPLPAGHDSESTMSQNGDSSAAESTRATDRASRGSTGSSVGVPSPASVASPTASAVAATPHAQSVALPPPRGNGVAPTKRRVTSSEWKQWVQAWATYDTMLQLQRHRNARAPDAPPSDTDATWQAVFPGGDAVGQDVHELFAPAIVSGLRNIGNTCFANCSMQCLASVPQLVTALRFVCGLGFNQPADATPALAQWRRRLQDMCMAERSGNSMGSPNRSPALWSPVQQRGAATSERDHSADGTMSAEETRVIMSQLQSGPRMLRPTATSAVADVVRHTHSTLERMQCDDDSGAAILAPAGLLRGVGVAYDTFANFGAQHDAAEWLLHGVLDAADEFNKDNSMSAMDLRRGLAITDGAATSAAPSAPTGGTTGGVGALQQQPFMGVPTPGLAFSSRHRIAAWTVMAQVNEANLRAEYAEKERRSLSDPNAGARRHAGGGGALLASYATWRAECGRTYSQLLQQSAASDAMRGTTITQIRCSKCGHVSRTFNAFASLELAFPSDAERLRYRNAVQRRRAEQERAHAPDSASVDVGTNQSRAKGKRTVAYMPPLTATGAPASTSPPPSPLGEMLDGDLAAALDANDGASTAASAQQQRSLFLRVVLFPVTVAASVFSAIARMCTSLFSSGDETVCEELTLDELLWIHCQAQQVDGYKCQGCHQAAAATLRTQFLELPEVLAVHLKRFEREGLLGSLMGAGKIQERVAFPLHADPQPLPARWRAHIERIASAAVARASAVIAGTTANSGGAAGAGAGPAAAESAVLDGLTEAASAALNAHALAHAALQGQATAFRSAATALSPRQTPLSPSLQDVAAPAEASALGRPALAASDAQSVLDLGPYLVNPYHLAARVTAELGGAANVTGADVSSPLLNADGEGRPLELPQHPAPLATYSLKGVVVHHGGLSAGHYVAYARKADAEDAAPPPSLSVDETFGDWPHRDAAGGRTARDVWVFCNDDRVGPSTERVVGRDQAYVLLYTRQCLFEEPPLLRRLRRIAREYLLGARCPAVAAAAHSVIADAAARATGDAETPEAEPVLVPRLWLHRVAAFSEPGPLLAWSRPREASVEQHAKDARTSRRL